MMKTKYKCKKNNNIKADNPKIFSGKTPQISYFYANKSENIYMHLIPKTSNDHSKDMQYGMYINV